jgi:hypothetical protein
MLCSVIDFAWFPVSNQVLVKAAGLQFSSAAAIDFVLNARLSMSISWDEHLMGQTHHSAGL